jgi:hypothetical protein
MKNKVDLTKLQHDRLAKAIPGVLNLFGTADHGIFLPENTEEGEKIFNDAAKKFFDGMLELFSKEGIVRGDYSDIFNNIRATIDIIEQMLKNQTGKLMNEILTTVINVTDPMGGNDIAYAKHTDLAAAVMKLREQYGGDEEHSSFYNKVDEPIPSPIDMTKPEE